MRAVLAAVVALLVVGCTTPPNPPPDGPGGAGGSAPPAVSCATACAHADQVCPGNSCGLTCSKVVAWDPGYPTCVAAAGGCYDCDAVARRSNGNKPVPVPSRK